MKQTFLNPKLIIGSLVFAALIAGVAMVSRGVVGVAPHSGEGTLGDLMSLQADLECQILYDDGELLTPMVGVYFVSGKQVRGDFELTVPELGGTVVSSIIYTPAEMFAWSTIAGEQFGVRTKVSTETQSGVTPKEVEGPIPTEGVFSYTCQPWETVDMSVFQPPSNVLFKDAQALLEAGMQYGTTFEGQEQQEI